MEITRSKSENDKICEWIFKSLKNRREEYLNYAARRLNDRGYAEDVLQDVALDMAKWDFSNYRGQVMEGEDESNPRIKSFLYTAIRIRCLKNNELNDRYDRRIMHRVNEAKADENIMIYNPTNEELEIDLQDLLEDESEIDKKIVYGVVSKIGFRDISIGVGISESFATKRMFSIRKRLAKKVDKKYHYLIPERFLRAS